MSDQPGISTVQLRIRQATPEDCETVSEILLEAAAWLTQRGMPLWRDNELTSSRIREDVAAGLFYLASSADGPVGTVKFQLSDPVFWPDVPDNDDAAYIHRLAVRRSAAGGSVSSGLLHWAAAQTARAGRRYLRLDCEASRPRLRAIYERFGFRHHSDRQIGPYHVSRYEYPVPPLAD